MEQCGRTLIRMTQLVNITPFVLATHTEVEIILPLSAE